jgi:4-hydroxythreonine-4-phosphate dehydrogenase
MERVKEAAKPKIGITLGDFNGIGPEVILKTLEDKRVTRHCIPIVYGSGKVLNKYKNLYKLQYFSYHQYHAGTFLHEKKPNVINCWKDTVEVEPGKVDPAAGQCALQSLQKATEDLKSGFIDAVVTAPINKANIQGAAFNFPGHTEYYTQNFSAADTSLMLLVADDLRIGVVTGHIAIKDVPAALTAAKLREKIHLMHNALIDDFMISRPRIAILGLNPHAGEMGLLGKEEQEVISPVITELHKKGVLVFGPYPADGFFGSANYRGFDGILAMYHDQGLIPFKAMAFERGVNYTAGLTIVRTSPDHGTAYSIAGKNLADPTSFREALFLALDIVRNRANKTESQLRVQLKGQLRTER